MTPEEVIRNYWAAMQTNDFAKASDWLTDDFEYFMPQSSEYLRGPEAFAALNTAFPATGLWRFKVRSIIAQGQEAVSDVAVTDGQRQDRAITFHTLRDGLICRQVEYWPDPYPAPDWRRPWVSLRPDFSF